MAFPTNANQVQAFAGALYGQQIGSVTMAQVTSDIAAVGGLNNALNSYYAASFGGLPTATVAASVAANLGLTGEALTAGTAYVEAQLNAAAANARGAVISNILNLFAGLSADATFGAAATAWNTKVDAAAAYTGATNVAIGSTVSQGNVFALTTGVDAYTGTAGNDSVSGILGTGATMNTFDVLNGGAGTDTLSLVDSTAAAFSVLPTSSSVAGFETVNLSRSAAAAATSIGVTVVDTTFGTGVKTLNVLEAGAATTAAAASVTLNSAEAISVISTGATKFNGVTVADTGTSAATAGSTLKTVTIQGGSTTANAIWGNAVTTVNLNDTGAVATVVNAAAGARAVTVNTSGIAAIGGFTDATATTLNINNSATNGTTAVALGTFTAAKATTVNYSSTAANASATLTAATATTLNVSGTKLATMTLTGNTVLATVNVTGTAGLTTDLTAGATAVTLLDTSGTTGIATVTVNNATAVTGGAGNDNITVGATTKAINLGGSTAVAAVTGVSNAITAANKVTLTSGTTVIGSGGSINGGTGSADVLSMVAADAATLTTAGAAAAVPTAFRSAVTGFEVLELAAAAGTITVDKKAVGTTFTTVALTGAAQTVTLNNMDNNDTVQITGANTGVVLAGSSGAGVDTINLKLVNTGAALAAFGSVTAPNSETVVITSVDAQVTPVGYYNSLTVVDAAASSIVVNGNSGLDLTFAGTAVTSFDASGVTLGGVKFTSGAQAYATTVKGTVKGGDTLNFDAALAAVNITATAGTNALTGSNTVASTITGGSGADTIKSGSGADVINGGAGADVIYADNAGTKGARTLTSVDAGIAATETMIAIVNGTTITYTMTADDVAGDAAADLLASTTKLAAAINADARLSKLVVATNALGVVTITSITDGALAVSGTSTDTLAMTASAASGSVGTSGKNVITGGAGADTFVFGVASSTPSATTFQTITDFASASDIIMFSAAPLTIMANATASAGTAAISAAGVATFAAGDSTLALRIAAVEAGINAGGAAAAGQVAVFQFESDAYAFISNGTDGVGAGDQLIKLTGVNTLDTAFDTVTLAAGNMTLA